VIPIAQWGVQTQFDLYKKKIKLIPRPRHTLSVGEPIDLTAFRDRDPNAKTLREVTDVIMRRLRGDVAELRGRTAPTGDLYRWIRSSEQKPDASKPESAA
jgi:1-acyl-sn-glycerol-3-phosphate acyltransferase